MSQQNLTLGFYGKLPSLGDFVSRRLPQDFISSWDSWLQSSLAVSRETLGEQWLDQYLTSPIWRFALSPGLSGKGAWLGVVMPSVDRVGRYFPLTIACEVPSNVSLIQLFLGECDWFEELESIALSALEDDLGVEEFDIQVKGITPLKVSVKSRSHHVKEQPQDNNAFYLEFDSTRIKTECILPSLSSLLLDTYSPGHSLWCSVGSDNIKPGVLVVDGMPPCTAYIGMITGEFLQTGWTLQQQQVEQSTQQSATKTPNERGSVNEQLHIHKERYIKVNRITATPEQRTLNKAWQSFAKTDPGKVRKYNEDAILDRPDLGLWVVADGMGGHQAGDVASRKIISTLNDLHLSLPLEFSVSQVKAALQLVNNELKELASRSYSDQIIGSTVVALIAGDTHFACLWAGDSRLYRLRDNKLLQLTVDHCSEQEYIADILDFGVNTELKQNNVITRAVGAYDELELDSQIFEVQSGDIFLLSSDGLDKELNFQEIEQVLVENVYNDSVEILLEQVLQSSARDNVSVIVVEIK